MDLPLSLSHFLSLKSLNTSSGAEGKNGAHYAAGTSPPEGPRPCPAAPGSPLRREPCPCPLPRPASPLFMGRVPSRVCPLFHPPRLGSGDTPPRPPPAPHPAGPPVDQILKGSPAQVCILSTWQGAWQPGAHRPEWDGGACAPSSRQQVVADRCLCSRQASASSQTGALSQGRREVECGRGTFHRGPGRPERGNLHPSGSRRMSLQQGLRLLAKALSTRGC